jgi:WD40 repeat protein
MSLIGASSGTLWRVDTSLPDRPPSPIITEHRQDVLDMQVRGDRVVTASRDGKVRIFDSNPLFSDIAAGSSLSLEVQGVMDHFEYYPRCVAFSNNGEWLGITDRGGNAYFREVSNLGMESSWDMRPYETHRGPVMCLETSEEDGADRFYTAGYDGRIIEYSLDERDPGRRWRSREVADLSPIVSTSGASRTIRAISIATNGPDAVGIWAGGEFGQLYYIPLHRKAEPYRIDGAAGQFFSISVSDDGRALALGSADGIVSVYQVEQASPPRLTLIDQFAVPCGDIIRGTHFLGRTSLFTISWAGCVRVRDFQSQAFSDAFVYRFDVGVALQRPAVDRGKLCFGPDAEAQLRNVRGLSTVFKDYLRKLSK